MKKCKICNGALHSKKYGNICCSCWTYFKSGGVIHRLPPVGTVVYDKEGNMICHICGKAYKKLGAHVINAHKISTKEYKKRFGLALDFGLCSEDLKKQLRSYITDDMVQKNLVQGGAETRFKPGTGGRKKDRVSLQTRKKLQEHAKSLNNKNKKDE